jgi:hypothetical protein
MRPNFSGFGGPALAASLGSLIASASGPHHMARLDLSRAEPRDCLTS